MHLVSRSSRIHVQWVGDRFDVYVDALKAKELDRLAARTWPDIEALEAKYVYGGLRQRSRTRRPGCAEVLLPCAKAALPAIQGNRSQLWAVFFSFGRRSTERVASCEASTGRAVGGCAEAFG